MSKKIVLLGDSMVDTYDFMGSGFPELKRELIKLAPSLDLELKNHGVGTTNVVLGLQRVTQPYDYSARGRKLPAVVDEHSDLVILESFAYNHLGDTPQDLEKYLDCHTQIIKILQAKASAKILLYATIAPNKSRYASGVINLNWSEEKRDQEYELIMKYFGAFREFANKSSLPFLDIFSKSLTPEGTGDLTYESNVDYVHLSFEGRVFISQHLAPKITELLS